MKKFIGTFILITLGISLIVSIVYGTTMLGKWLSYKLFYEAQVRETVHQVLREERLR